MPQPQLSTSTIRKLLNRCDADDFNKAQTAKQLRISRSSAKKYITAFKQTSLTLSQIDSLPRARLIDRLFPGSKHQAPSPRKLRLLACLPSIHSRIEIDGLSILDVWREVANQCDYKYTQFASLYATWRSEHGLGRISRAKMQLITVSPTDCAVFKRWQRSHNRRQWEVGVALLDLSSGHKVPAICQKIGRARQTVGRWRTIYEHKGINGLDPLFRRTKYPSPSSRKFRLLACLSSIHSRIEIDGLSILDVWREVANRCDYKYTQFASLYAAWRLEYGLGRISRAKRQLITVSPTDCAVFKRWQRSHNRRKWEVSVALLGLSSCHTVSEICQKIGRAWRTVEKWCATYQRVGLDGLPVNRIRKLSEKTQILIKEKKERLIKIIHETPNAYDINRASWSLQALSEAYEKTYGERVSRSSISEYFIAAGYKFKKAKKSLTSSDPTYREKLNKITSTLSCLASDEKFFSIDEFGPFSVRTRGGTALVPGDQIRTIPQRQRSRGSLICTAALELSSNQILHFYSKKKNSKEMIKLLRRLITRYRDQKRIFVSWDSASWHASKLLYKIVDEMNCDEFRSRHKTPLVELIPLPSGAQFLNVIESVFSGMARAILHNSDYRNVDACKAAIDMYFADRNRAFLERPRRAGDKIWGKERVEAVFKEENNCKDPRWR